MQSVHAISKGDVLQRITGIAFVVGAIATLVGNILFPHAADPADVTNRIAEVGGDETRTLIASLTIIAGLWALLLGVAGIYRSVTSARAAPWARLGFYMVLVGTTIATVSFGAILGSLDSDASWVTAGSVVGTTDYAIAASLLELGNEMFNLTIMSLWLGFLVVGVAMVLSGAYPKWLGWVLVVIATVVMAIGIPRFFTDLTESGELIFAIPAGLTSIWAVVMGIWVVRNAW